MHQGITQRQEQPDRRRQVHHLTWTDISRITERFTHAIHTCPAPDIIIGLQRGGLIPAVLLSHRLGGEQAFLSLPIRSTTSDGTYATKVAPVIGAVANLGQITGKHLLVVDDIAGSGATLRATLDLLQQYTPASIQSAVYAVNRVHWDAANTRPPQECISHIGTERACWVVFPWEKEGTAAPESYA